MESSTVRICAQSTHPLCSFRGPAPAPRATNGGPAAAHLQCGAPLVLQDVQANPAELVNVGVIHLGQEPDLRAPAAGPGARGPRPLAEHPRCCAACAAGLRCPRSCRVTLGGAMGYSSGKKSSSLNTPPAGRPSVEASCSIPRPQQAVDTPAGPSPRPATAKDPPCFQRALPGPARSARRRATTRPRAAVPRPIGGTRGAPRITTARNVRRHAPRRAGTRRGGR